MKPYINIINVVACFAVVMIHADKAFWEFSYAPYWTFANIVYHLSVFCVPLFFMSSGDTLLDYRSRYDTKTFLIKRCVKIFIPFLVWSLLSLLSRVVLNIGAVRTLSVSGVIQGVFNTQYNNVYWFFIPLFAIYLSMPVLSLIAPNQPKKRQHIFLYMFLLWFLLNCVLPLVCQWLHIQYNPGLLFPIMGGYLFYTVAGYYIGYYPIPKWARYTLYALGIAALAVNIIVSQVVRYQTGKAVDTPEDYLSIPTIVYSLAVFTGIRYLPQGVQKVVDKICKPFKKLTFGIYLMHMFIMGAIRRLFFVHYLHPIIILLTAVITFLLSAFLTFVLKKIPVLRKIVP